MPCESKGRTMPRPDQQAEAAAEVEVEEEVEAELKATAETEAMPRELVAYLGPPEVGVGVPNS
jgi:hypothetical protein